MNSEKMCLLERVLRASGFVMVHNGQQNPGQIILPPEEVACFTRKYRLTIDGEFVNTWVTFKYDRRSQFADFEVYSREPETRGREKMVLGSSDLGLGVDVKEETKKELEVKKAA